MHHASPAPLLPPRYATCTVRPPRFAPTRRFDVAPSGLVTWATTLPLYAADERATVIPAVAS